MTSLELVFQILISLSSTVRFVAYDTVPYTLRAERGNDNWHLSQFDMTALTGLRDLTE